MQKPETKAATSEISPISDDEDDTERCPLCKIRNAKPTYLPALTSQETGVNSELG